MQYREFRDAVIQFTCPSCDMRHEVRNTYFNKLQRHEQCCLACSCGRYFNTKRRVKNAS